MYARKSKKDRSEPVFFIGGELEIRTLEPCYRLHDFQQRHSHPEEPQSREELKLRAQN